MLFPLLKKVAQSINDHHLEVIRFCKESGFHGLVAQDADYAAFCPPHYFGASSLKLSRNGKNLTASEFLLPEVARALDLPLERFPVFAALLGVWSESGRVGESGSKLSRNDCRRRVGCI